MAKRFTDTDKWKKPFIRALDGPYKLLWFYILDDCDHAGIWSVDFEVAKIKVGLLISEKEALNKFGDRVQVLNGGSKWFLRDFIDFQYGPLNPANRMHLSVINILNKNNIKPLTSPLQGAKDKDKEQDKDKDKVVPEVKIIGTGTNYIICNGYRIQGADGLNEFYQMHRSIITHTSYTDKFLRDRNGKPFNDFKHVWNDFNDWVNKQYQK